MAKPRNFVAKHMNTFNRAATHKDRTKYSRNNKWDDEWDYDCLEQPAIANPSDFETTSLSLDEG